MVAKPKVTLDDLEDFFYSGEVGSVGRNEEISFRGIDYEVSKVVRQHPQRIELSFTHPGSKHALNSFKGGIFKAVKGAFSGWSGGEQKYGGYAALKWPGGVLHLSPEEDEDAGSGTVPAHVHEAGTAKVFSRALASKKPFKSEDDLQNDDNLTKELKKIFGTKWEHRRKQWTHSYYEQQEAALKEYSHPAWEEFVYGNKAFVKFFEDHIQNLYRDFKPEDRVTRYETWNPSDIWAVKKGQMDNIKRDLKKVIDKKTHLAKLNSMLVQLMEDNDLVGISLKKIDKKSSGTIKIFNVDTSPALKALKAYSPLEKFDMGDIHFEPDNVLMAKNVTTYIRYGAQDKFSINITRGGGTVTFNSQIKGAAAQGGQTPIDAVIKLLKGSKFDKSNKSPKYPQDATAFVKDEKNWKKIYTTVAQHASSRSQRMKFEDWQKEITLLYAKDRRDTMVMLMQLSFWYDALTKYEKDPEFWTNMLYFGMKITSKGGFAPHAKIS